MKATSRYVHCAALASAALLPYSTHAFSIVTNHPASVTRPASSAITSISTSPFLSNSDCTNNIFPLQHQTQAARLLSSRRNYDWDPDEDKPKKDKNFLEKAADAVKSFLPAKWFQSDEEKRAAIEKKQREEEISGALDQVFKDAPLGMRMMGKMAGKVVSQMASGLSEQMRESSRQLQDYLDDARSYIAADGLARQVLGEPIEVGVPFSQSSSTSIINGQKSVNIQASFEVRGSRGAGVATMVANDSGIRQLQVQAGGRVFEVNTSGSPKVSVSDSFGGASSRMRSGGTKGRGQVIDAEIIDAEYTEKK